ILASVSGAKLSASSSLRSRFIRATLSPATGRRPPAAPSSVVIISASAVPTQATSSRPVTFLNPSSATAGRVSRAVAVLPPPRHPPETGARRGAAQPRGQPRPPAARRRRLERIAERAHAGEPSGRLALEAAQDRVLPAGVEVGREPARRRGQLLQPLHRHAHRR